MVTEDTFERFQAVAWRFELLIVILLIAQVAAWRGWFWPLRLFLHVSWIVMFLYARGLLD